MQRKNDNMEAISKTMPYLSSENKESLGDNYCTTTFLKSGDEENHSKLRGKSRRERLRDILAPRSRTRDLASLPGASSKRQQGNVLGRVKIPKLGYGSSEPRRMRGRDRSNSMPLILPPIPTSRTADTYPILNSRARHNGEPKASMPRPSKYKMSHSLGALPDRKNEGPSYANKHLLSPKYSKKQPSKALADPDALVFKASRRINREMRSSELAAGLKKTKEPDVANSIRKKIEQYKKWHDEHYKVQLNQFKQESEKKEEKPDPLIGEMKGENALNEGVTKLGDFNPGIRLPQQKTVLPQIKMKTAEKKKDIAGNCTPKNEKTVAKKIPMKDSNTDEVTPSSRTESPPAEVPEEFRNIRHSAKTWKSWRNRNESFCYSNVKQYIKDNELMDDEKEKHIHKWLDNVHEATGTTGPTSEGQFDIDPSSKLDTG